MRKLNSIKKVNGILYHSEPFATNFHFENEPNEPSPYQSPMPFIGNVDLNSNYFRIPGVEKLNDGTIISFAQVQYAGTSDYTHQDIGFSKSVDGGKTWGDKKIVCKALNENSRVMNPTTIYDKTNNRLILMVTEVFNTDHVVWWRTGDTMWDTYVLVSDDGGETWTKNSIKNDLITTRQTNWTVSMPGLGTGVVMPNGMYVFPMETGFDDGSTNKIQNTLAISTDLVNWSLSNPTPELGDEANIVLLNEDTIILNARNYGTMTPKMRKIFVTSNLGTTWEPHATHQTIPENRATMGHTLKIKIDGVEHIVFSHMQSENTTRKKLGISVLNNSKTAWREVAVIDPEPFDGYSILAWNENEPTKLNILYEKGGNILCLNISHLLTKIKITALT